MVPWLGYLATFLQFGCFVAVGYVLIDPVETDSPRLRFVLTALAAFLLQTVAFYGLAITGGFERGPVLLLGLLGVTTAAGWAIRRDGFGSRLRCDGAAVVDFARWTCRGRRAWATSSVGVLFIIHALRALAIPPLAWDALTYHLVRAGLWVKRGGIPAFGVNTAPPEWFDARAFADYGAPEAWTYYRHFLPLGDALSAWTMLPSHSDALVPLTWAAVWSVLVGSTYTVAREMGSSRSLAWLAALGAGVIPAVRAHLFTSYVDNLVTALVLVGTACFLGAERRGKSRLIVPGLWAFAGAAAAKKTGLPFLAAAAVTYLAWRHREQLAWTTIAGGIVGSCLVALPPFAYLWWATGSPLYPKGFGGVAANPAWEFLYQEHQLRPLWLHAKRLVASGYGSWLRHLNLGPIFTVVGPLGCYVLAERMYREDARAALAPLLIGGGIVACLILSDLRGSGLNHARYWIALPIAMLLALAERGAEWATASLVLVLIQGVVLWAIPIQWGTSDATATLHLFMALAPCLAVAAVLVAVGRHRSWPLAGRLGVAGLTCLLGVSLVLEPVRTSHRSAVYDELHQNQGLRPIANIPIEGPSLPSGAYLEHLSDGARIAVTSGWDGKGHNWYVYPLLGPRLRRDVLFVPSRRTFSTPLRRYDSSAAEPDIRAWRRRLRRLDVDYVATLHPEPPELDDMLSHPEWFEPIVSSPDATGTRLFRFESNSNRAHSTSP